MNSSTKEIRSLLERSRLLSRKVVDDAFSGGSTVGWDTLVRSGLLTSYQARLLETEREEQFYLTEKYKILEFLGLGGMGKVYLCEHLLLRRIVAVKVLQIPDAEDSHQTELIRERFFREARAVAALDHPNIVRVYDVDQSDSAPFMVMEYVDGLNLHDLVARRGTVPPERAAEYIAQAARGLHHAHEAGLLHRDIKPANIMVDREGVVKILDLGLARFHLDPTRNEGLTDRYDYRILVGTVDFMSPEQAENSSEIDARADVYSLGCTFYYLLTGILPYPNMSIAQKMYSHAHLAPAPVSEIVPLIDRELLEILERSISKDRSERHQTAAELADALAAWSPPKPSPLSSIELPPRPVAGYRLGLSPSAPAIRTDRPASKTDRVDGSGAPTNPVIRRTPKHGSGHSGAAVSTPSSIRASDTIPGVPMPLRKNRKWQFGLGLALATILLIVTAILLTGNRERPLAERPGTDPEPKNPLGKATPVPAVPTIVVSGGGSTFVGPVMRRWAETFETARGIRIDYRGVGSTKGVDGTIDRLYQFGCTDVALSDNRMATATERHGEIVHIPLVLGAVAATYNLPQLKKPLRFTGPALAGIYLGKIQRWNDPVLKASNPGIDLPDLPIRIVGRDEGSGTTYIWTHYLSRVSGEFEAKHGAKTDLSLSGVQKARGNAGVADLVSRTVGSIGYVELSYARENALPVGEIRNRSSRFVAPTSEGVTAAATELIGTIPEDLRFTLTDAPGDASYPLAGTAFAILYLDQRNQPNAGELIDFLRWATNEGQSMVAEMGYSPLPPELTSRIQARIARIRR